MTLSHTHTHTQSHTHTVSHTDTVTHIHAHAHTLTHRSCNLLNQCRYLSNLPNPPTDHTHAYIDHTHHFLCRNSLEQVGVIGCGLVEAVVHFVSATTVELETLEDGEEQPHNYQKLQSWWGKKTRKIDCTSKLIMCSFKWLSFSSITAIEHNITWLHWSITWLHWSITWPPLFNQMAPLIIHMTTPTVTSCRKNRFRYFSCSKSLCLVMSCPS